MIFQEKGLGQKLWFVKVRDTSCALSFGLVSQAWKNLSGISSERILVLYQGYFSFNYKEFQGYLRA